jgi:hypothetical protein
MMIIALDLLPVQLAGIEKDLLQDRMSALLRAHRLGCNFVVTTRETATWLLNHMILLERDKSTLKRILNDVTQNGALLRGTRRLIRIDEPQTALQVINGQEYRLPIDLYQFEDIINKPAFVIEDIQNDLGIYEFVFRNMPAPFNGFPLGYEVIHGGGQNTFTVAAAKASEGRIVCVVADADCKSPFEMDQRRQTISETIAKSEWPFLFHFLTPCSELENLFNLEVLFHLKQIRTSGTFATIQRIEVEERRLKLNSSESFRLYFDMKNGISEKTVERMSGASGRSWITERLQLAGIRSSNASLLGFGPNIVRQVLNSNKCMAEFRRMVRSPEWQEVFGDFVIGIMWTLAAPLAQRT